MGSGSLDESLIVWSIRLGMIAYIVALVELLLARQTDRARVAWSVGALACVAHIALAMHFQHRWSHAAAYAEIARQTHEMIGLDWGGGIYINYLFALVWLADAAWWWIAPAMRAARGKWLSWLTHGFLAFIIFNATIVFKTGPTRWTAAAGCLVVVALAGLAMHRSQLRTA
jgi:hypothetical protein